MNAPRRRIWFTLTWQAIVSVTAVGGSIASIVALWPIYFPPAQAPISQPQPAPESHFGAETSRDGVVIRRFKPAAGITVNVFSLVQISGTHKFAASPNVSEAGFIGWVCGPLSYGSTGGDRILNIPADEYTNWRAHLEKRFEKLADFHLIGQDYNLRPSNLNDPLMSLRLYIRLHFENEFGNRTARYFAVDPASRSGTVIAQKQFEDKDAIRRKLLTSDTSGQDVQQPYQCVMGEFQVP